jgi:hypothetical protein
MPWSFPSVEHFEQLATECRADIHAWLHEGHTMEDSAQQCLFALKRWPEFLKEVTDFEEAGSDPTVLPIVREFGSAKPVYRIFRRKPFNVIYRCDHRSTQAAAAFVFHDRDSVKSIGMTFR